MSFNSWQFAIFLPIVFILYWVLPQKYRWILLFAASYYFYMSWKAEYVFLILFTTAVSYFAALLLEKTDNKSIKKLILASALVICFGVLFVFKYYNFFFAQVTKLFAKFAIELHPTTLSLLLPVGISFYTFQTASYVIDVYRGTVPAEKHFGIYATFVSFFPQLVAGPIERTSNLLPQIKEEHSFNYGQACYGMKLMAWGFFKKMVVADNLAVFIDAIYNNMYSYKGFVLVITVLLFSIQIYCDFGGYSDIARGAAKLLGIELMENFKSPFFSTSVNQMWGRWHISLTSWLRDYIYFPLGGSRCSRARKCFNIMVTNLVSGLWHGADWTFVVWGAGNGLGQLFDEIFHIKPYKKRGTVIWWLRVAVIFCFCTATGIFFRSQSCYDAFYVLGHLFTGISHPLTYFARGWSEFGLDEIGNLLKVALCVLPLAFYDYFSLDYDVIDVISHKKAWLRYSVYIILVLVILLMHSTSGVSFVYFQF